MDKNEDMKRVTVIYDGTESETIDDVVTLPREEYDELVKAAAKLEVVERVVERLDMFHLREILETVLDIRHEYDDDDDELPAGDGLPEEEDE